MGHTRYVVVLAVLAVLLVAVSLFLLASWLAVVGVWHAFRDAFAGELDATALTVDFLEVISAMLKAVIFYLVGVGLYSLFIGPLNPTTVLGVETLGDLERKVASIVILILAVTVLEHFIRWEDPADTLRFGATLALVVAALVAFQVVSQRAAQEVRTSGPAAQARAQRELYTEAIEERTTPADDLPTTEPPAPRRPLARPRTVLPRQKRR